STIDKIDRAAVAPITDEGRQSCEILFDAPPFLKAVLHLDDRKVAVHATGLVNEKVWNDGGKLRIADQERMTAFVNLAVETIGRFLWPKPANLMIELVAIDTLAKRRIAPCDRQLKIKVGNPLGRGAQDVVETFHLPLNLLRHLARRRRCRQ